MTMVALTKPTVTEGELPELKRTLTTAMLTQLEVMMAMEATALTCTDGGRAVAHDGGDGGGASDGNADAAVVLSVVLTAVEPV